MDAQEKQESLWEFGEYSKTNSDLTPSKAPRIPDILKNTNLWLLFIKHFPKMKPKDTDIQAVIEGVMNRVKGVNTSKYDDSIFVWWYRKVCHLQITHIRDLIKYPDRYEYRINQLGDEDAAKLEKSGPWPSKFMGVNLQLHRLRPRNRDLTGDRQVVRDALRLQGSSL